MSPHRPTVIIEDRIPAPEVRERVKVYTISNPKKSLPSKVYDLLHPTKTRTVTTREIGTVSTAHRSRRHSDSFAASDVYYPARVPPPTSLRTHTDYRVEINQAPPACPDPPRRRRSTRMSPRRQDFVPLPPSQPPLEPQVRIEDRRPSPEPERTPVHEANSATPHRRGSHRRNHRPSVHEVRGSLLEASERPTPEPGNYVVEQNRSGRLGRREEARLSQHLDLAREAVRRKTEELGEANIRIAQLQRDLAAVTLEGQRQAYRAEQAEHRIADLQRTLKHSEAERLVTIKERQLALQQLEGQSKLHAIQAAAAQRDDTEARDPPDAAEGRGFRQRRGTGVSADQRRPRIFDNPNRPDAGLEAIRRAQEDRRNASRGDERLGGS